MLNRNAIVNQKLKDYIKINYGLEPNLDTFNMSHYLGSSLDQLIVGDVMSNADTMQASGNVGALLGQYAGKGRVKEIVTRFRSMLNVDTLIIEWTWSNIL